MALSIEQLGTSLKKLADDVRGMGDREIRNLIHLKQNKLKLGKGFPFKSQGNNGDMRMNITSTGVRLYIKFQNTWFGFKPDFLDNEEYTGGT